MRTVWQLIVLEPHLIAQEMQLFVYKNQTDRLKKQTVPPAQFDANFCSDYISDRVGFVTVFVTLFKRRMEITE